MEQPQFGGAARAIPSNNTIKMGRECFRSTKFTRNTELLGNTDFLEITRISMEIV